MKEVPDADRAAMKLYVDLLSDIKTRIRQAQVRAGMSANAEMIRLYWDIGRMVAERQQAEGWGKGLLRRLAADLKNDISEIKGFSERNIQLMIQFQAEYPDLFPIPQRAVAELPETPLGGEIRPRPVAELAPPTMEQVTAGEEEAQIAQRTVAQLRLDHNIALDCPYNALLNWVQGQEAGT